jgi:plastocyanin
MKKITIYIIIILVIIIGAVYFLISSPKSSIQTNQEQGPTTQTSPASVVTQPEVISPVTAPETTLAETYNVSAVNFSFSPAVLNINKGDTVIWTNEDSAPHQIAGKSFNGSVMSKGQTYSFIFNNIGTFDYYCAIHPSMKGTVIVK